MAWVELFRLQKANREKGETANWAECTLDHLLWWKWSYLTFFEQFHEIGVQMGHMSLIAMTFFHSSFLFFSLPQRERIEIINFILPFGPWCFRSSAHVSVFLSTWFSVIVMRWWFWQWRGAIIAVTPSNFTLRLFLDEHLHNCRDSIRLWASLSFPDV